MAKDLNVILLAGATEGEDFISLVEKTLEKYQSGHDQHDHQWAAGKYVATLYDTYLLDQVSVESLDNQFTILYTHLGYPSRLMMLSRNFEYATEIIDFKEPFEEECGYIAGLRASSAGLEEFEVNYSRAVSDQHDVRWIIYRTRFEE